MTFRHRHRHKHAHSHWRQPDDEWCIKELKELVEEASKTHITLKKRMILLTFLNKVEEEREDHG